MGVEKPPHDNPAMACCHCIFMQISILFHFKTIINQFL